MQESPSAEERLFIARRSRGIVSRDPTIDPVAVLRGYSEAEARSPTLLCWFIASDERAAKA